MSAGHPFADEYPLGRLFDEAALITERMTSQLEMQAVLAQSALAAVHSKKGPPAFKKAIASLEFSTHPRLDIFGDNDEE